jgi:hypothetical protein
MKRFLVVAFAAFVAVVLIRRLVASRGEDWEARIERMPDSSPPTWLFTTLSAIRSNRDEIRERVSQKEVPVA